MTTAIIGTGNIGGQVARHLVAGGEQVILAARDESHAAALATELGPLASAASVRQAIAAADDKGAAATVEHLIATAGFDAVKAGGLRDATRIEVAGDLHQYGGLNGNVVDADEARAAVAVAA